MNQGDLKEGGYPVPNRIAIWLLRLRLLQMLADKAESGKVYWFDKTGMVYSKKRGKYE